MARFPLLSKHPQILPELPDPENGVRHALVCDNNNTALVVHICYQSSIYVNMCYFATTVSL